MCVSDTRLGATLAWTRALSGPPRYLLAALILTAATAAVFAPLLGSLTTHVLAAEFTDSRNAIRGVWLIQNEHSTPFTLARDRFNGAPEGTRLVPATSIASPLQPAVTWALTPVLGAIAAFNAFLLAGVVATAFSAFVLLDSLAFGFLPSLIGGYIVALNPWSVERAVAGAPAFNHGWCLILLVAALIRLYRRPTVRSAVVAGLAYASCFLVAAYFGLVGFAFVLAYAVAAIVWPRVPTTWAATLRNLLVMAAVTLVPLIPAVTAFLLHREANTQTLSNPGGELVQRGASPLASYFLPSPRHPLVGHILHSLRPPDPLREKILFFGYTTLALAVATLVLLRRRDVFSERQRAALTLAAVAAPIAWVLSWPASFRVFGTQIDTPSHLFGIFTSFYRVYARIGYAAGIALTILAVAALSRLAQRRRGQLVVALLGALIAFEFLPGTLPLQAADKPPAYDRWLATQPRGIVAHYPLPTDNELALILQGTEYYNQRFTRQRNFNLFGAGVGGTREEGIRLLARYVDQPLAARILAAEGVRYVVIHDDVYRALHQQPPVVGPPTFRHLRTFGDVRIYAITPKPDAHLVDKLLLRYAPSVAELEGLEFGSVQVGPEGFLKPERYHNVFGWRWMTQAGVLRVRNPYDHPMRFRLFAHAFSNTVPRTIEVDTALGEKVASFRVPTYETPLKLRPLLLQPGVTQLNLFATPDPQPLGLRDPRVASIYLGPIRVVPLNDVSLRNE